MEYTRLGNQVTNSDAESEIVDNESSQFGFLLRNGMVRVEEREDDTDTLVNIIKKVFLTSTRIFGNDLRIVAIHRHSRLGLAGESWAERFRIFSKAVAENNGGAANIKYGWYGDSKDKICEILSYGFRPCQRPLNNKLFSHGVHLSPSNLCIYSVGSSSADENGLRHMLLCRVLLGNTEEVSVGSEKFQPSCSEFDSGVDNLLAPTKYIIWSPYINSHILPSFVITFTVTPHQFPSLLTNVEQNLDATVTTSTEKLPSIPLPRRTATAYSSNSTFKTTISKLLEQLSKYLDSSTMGFIAKVYVQYRRNKTTRTQMIRSLRTIVGDKLLLAATKEILRQKNFNLNDMIRSSTGEVPKRPMRCAATNSSNSKVYSTIPNLIKILAKDLDFSKRVSVAQVYSELRQNRITKVQMLRSLRTIAGDQLLRAAATEIFKPTASFP